MLVRRGICWHGRSAVARQCQLRFLYAQARRLMIKRGQWLAWNSNILCNIGPHLSVIARTGRWAVSVSCRACRVGGTGSTPGRRSGSRADFASVVLAEAGRRTETIRVEQYEPGPAHAGDQATLFEVTDHPPRHLS